MKILFLDIDGVLNRNKTWDGRVDQSLVDLLLNFVRQEGITIVISSSWRRYPSNILDLNKYGIMDYVHSDWCTPIHEDRPYYKRGDEIEEWLLNHPTIKNYVIVDDLSDYSFPQHKGRFVKTNSEKGLTTEHIDVMKHILLRSEKNE